MYVQQLVYYKIKNISNLLCNVNRGKVYLLR